jgi:hypothetical protein
MLTIIILAASYTLLKQLNRTPAQVLRAADNTRALGEARAALVGYALKSTTRPGELPCPDTDDPAANTSGESNEGTLGTGCSGYIGRLPWKTLGLDDPRDDSGERLWYALDVAFSKNSTTVLNSDTAASLVLDGDTSRRYAAIVFAPGPVLEGQLRPPGPARTNVARYLEDDNANGDINFISTAAGNFNDQVLALGDTDLLQAVEYRVLNQLKKAIRDFAGPLPSPADNGTTTCNPAAQQGLLPVPDATCPAASLPSWPSWFSNWQSLIWYAADPASSSISLKEGGSTSTGIQAIVISAGPALAFQARTASVPPALNTLLEGINNDDGGLDLAFEKLPLSANSNDQIVIVQP